MDRNNLKTYAPKARRDFIQAMKTRAAFYGITETKITAIEVRGDVIVIGGQDHPKAVAAKRQKLEARIARNGYEQTMEALAYTWFNRFAAIRYMEVNGYLTHGYRVLSHPEGKSLPEILEHAEDVDLPNFSGATIRRLKIEGNRERDIYRMVLVAQCNALNEAMPFLFEKIDDETELLLPDNLLNSDSIIGKLVSEIGEADWRQIEIIGWLYQFYISEKKDQVIGKVVKSEDIPAATQLFTPNWIVKYMVQNSLGAMWLATYPTSAIRADMKYLVPAADQTPEVAAQIAAVTPTEIDPEKITFLDPAVGSGHIVVEAYDILLAIYMDRGYQKRDAVRSILTKNLFGLDIDDRAAQMAGFALLMKARADDRTILKNPPKLNILAIQDSAGIDADAAAQALLPVDEKFELVPSNDLMPETLPQPTLVVRQHDGKKDERLRNAIKSIVVLFSDAKTFGSLLTVQEDILACLPDLETLLARPISGDLFAQQAQTEAQEQLAPLVAQARILGRSYDCVAANPPYMGSNGMNGQLKAWVKSSFPNGKSDLMTCFMERCSSLNKINGRWGMINLPSWMFLSSFENFRQEFLRNQAIESLLHLGRGIFGSDFGSVAFVVCNSKQNADRVATYRRLFEKHVDVRTPEVIAEKFLNYTYSLFIFAQSRFRQIPGSPIAYWLSDSTLDGFVKGTAIATIGDVLVGLQTGDNERFIRYWHEPSFSQTRMCVDVGRWVPYVKGGEFKKWYGNRDLVLDWSDNGSEIIRHPSARPQNRDAYFNEGITYTNISSGSFSARYVDGSGIFDQKGSMIFTKDRYKINAVMALLLSKVGSLYLDILCPTIDFNPGSVGRVPMLLLDSAEIAKNTRTLIANAKLDWDSSEISWDFSIPPILSVQRKGNLIPAAYENIISYRNEMIEETRSLEEENNRLFIDAYNLSDELSPEVPLNEITLACNPRYRYGGKKTAVELEELLRGDTMRELVSFVVGCSMGRYSLDKSGLVYALNGNEYFDVRQYITFPATDDGIVPLVDRDWGIKHDATSLVEKFLETAWPKENLEANLKFVADSLGPNNGEAARDTIRRYLCVGFYKHHLTTYKKRPIYWLFSSGKERAFQCLVYLHRYNESTLARMRIAYVVPLQGKIAFRIEQLADDISRAPSTSHRRKLQKEQDDLKKQQIELKKFEENLKHYADMQITLDLDEGVKANYGKFGDLLAEAKAITGGRDDQ